MPSSLVRIGAGRGAGDKTQAAQPPKDDGKDMPSNTTPTVDAIGKIHLEGNTIPASWYQNIRTKENKPDFLAITILSDVVYWYRPSEIRDEETGRVIGYKKKFAADKLQRGYEQLAEQFSVSKEMARDACHRLRDAGLMTIEIRHGVRYGQGMIANNVVYLEPVPSAVLEISYRVTQMGVAKQPTPPSNVETNTETTAKISTEKNNNKKPTFEAMSEPQTQAWRELANTLVTFSPDVIEKFCDIWERFPDVRRHAFAIAQMKKYADAPSFRYYETTFLRYDPDKPPVEKTYPKPREQFTRPEGAKFSRLPIRTD